MKKILLFLAKGFESYEASVFIDIFGWSMSDNNDVKITTCGFTEYVTGTFNIIIKSDCTVDQINISEFDALAIPGGFEKYGFYEEAYSDKLSQIIRDFNNTGKPIATICVAALALGNSGILKGRNATTYKGRRQEQLSLFGANVIDKSIVIDNNIITSWNPATAIDVALLLLEMVTSKKNANEIRRKMGFA